MTKDDLDQTGTVFVQNLDHSFRRKLVRDLVEVANLRSQDRPYPPRAAHVHGFGVANGEVAHVGRKIATIHVLGLLQFALANRGLRGLQKQPTSRV